MPYVDDWEKIKERHLAWWEGEIVDRMAIMISAPRDPARPFRYPPDLDLDRFWTDTDYNLELFEQQFAATYYAGDNFPYYMPFLGPVCLAAFVGCRLSYHRTRTCWLEPIIESWDDPPELTIDPANRWWRVMQEMTRAAAERGRDRFWVGLTDLSHPGDDIAALRGTQNALMDFADVPDKVDETMSRMCDLWERAIDELYGLIRAAGQHGSAGTFGIYSPGKSYTMQSDFSCMLSEAMFDRHIVPVLRRQAAHLDHAIYHVDGPDAVRHIPSVAAVPGIQALNWIAGEGHGPMRKWAPLIKRMQDLGKPVQIGAAPEDVEPILEVASPRGLLMNVRCASKDEADGLVRKAERWTAQYAR
ncbi:MAG: hypothetical protein R6V58_08835 [Planctomycetota bacterium]